MTKLAIKYIMRQKGVIVNHSSGAGFGGGIIALTKSLAAEYAPRVRVNCICPGYIKTPMYDRVEGQDNSINPSELVPLNRLGKAEEVAEAVIFLTSERAS